MKADLHVHSKFSRRPSEWILQKLGCPESFTEPRTLYAIAKARGMSFVTITDHNAVDGCLEIADRPECFMSEEVTTYFPEDGCKLHVLVYDIDEKIHAEIQRLRENVYDLSAYLDGIGIVYVLAHPLYSVNGKLTVDHFEKLLLTFRNFELNGARNEEQNRCLAIVLRSLTPQMIDRLADKHNMAPSFDMPWQKNIVGGSDDHSSLTIATRYTHVPGGETVADFLAGISTGKAVVMGAESTPKALGRNLYSIAYQFYGHKFNLDRYVNDDLLFNLLHRFLSADTKRELGWTARLSSLWTSYARRRSSDKYESGILSLLKTEAHKLIWDDPELSQLVRNGNGRRESVDQQWLQFVSTISSRVLSRFTDQIIDSLAGAHFINVFDSLGSAGALCCLLAPYFVAYSLYAQDRRFGHKILGHFTAPRSGTEPASPQEVRVAHFTDTLYETNGVARTLRKQARIALKTGKKYEVITCDVGNDRSEEGIRSFMATGVHELSVYPEQKLYYPPFLDMLDYCYKRDFTHVHAATPGTLGLAALGIAKILKLPIVGTYHTALPQYAEYLTNDHSVSDAVWRYIVWFYDQMDRVWVPSSASGRELADKGIHPSKIMLIPRGVESDELRPDKRNGMFDNDSECRGKLKLLYVGRVSKEKNLPILVAAFRLLARERKNVCLIVVGDGPYRAEMEQALQGAPCHFTGYLHGKALAEAYASCDLFVFPSTTDTFGNVVLEAQASGLPVVVTELGGPSENVIDGETALIVKGNDEQSLFQGLLTLVDYPERLLTMGKSARAYAEGRSFERAFLSTWDMYSTVSCHPPESSCTFANTPDADLIASSLTNKPPFAA